MTISDDRLEQLMRSGEHAKLNARLGIPPRFWRKNLDNLLDRKSDITAAVKAIADGRGVFMYGPCGTGKTHLATGLLLQIMTGIIMDWRRTEKNTPHRQGLFLSCQEFFEEIRRDFSRNAARAETAQKYAGIDFLLIDDFAAGIFHDWQREALNLLIDRRYRENRLTLITSNLDLGKIGSDIDDRSASRIAEMCAVIRLEGADYRVNPIPQQQPLVALVK